MPEPQAEANLLWAYALVDGLAASGVNQAVISPGSRSTPLVLACDAHPAIRTRVLVDERSAAFLALGQARASRRPVILIATSGSAPAHWHPAVIEACHGNVPLILLSADRPPELHGWGANQTTNQQQLFAGHLRAFHDPGPAVADESARNALKAQTIQLGLRAQHPHPGPVQINLPFREPLVPDIRPTLPETTAPVISQRPAETPEPDTLAGINALLSEGPGMILCGASDPGAGFADAVTALARHLNCPLLADPLSNLRHGTHDQGRLLCHYDAYIEHLSGQAPAWILRFGAQPVSKPLLQSLQQMATPVILCDPYRQWPARPPHTRIVTHADPLRLCQALCQAPPPAIDPGWCERFLRAEQVAASVMRAETEEDRPFEGSLIQALLPQLPPHSLLFCGNSMPIRQLDSWSGRGERPLHLAANRGVSGIDGNLATFIGMTERVSGLAVALVGDLAFYHDMNSLLAAGDRKLLIILINNQGGGIFGYLPQARLPGYEAYWNSATGLAFRHAANLYRLHYQRVDQQSQFLPALKNAIAGDGPHLVEVTVDRAFSIRHHRAYRQAVADQLAGAATAPAFV